MEILFGLLAFSVLLALWVVMPHRIVHRRRPAAPARSPGHAPVGTTLLRTQGGQKRRRTWRSSLVGMRLTRTPAAGQNGEPRFWLIIEFAGNGRSEARVPVLHQLRHDGHVLWKERYHTEIAGVRLEAGNLPALEGAVREVIGWLFDGQRLPHYWLDPPGHPTVPVFLREGCYVARVRGGPEFAATSLATVRDRLIAYVGNQTCGVRALSLTNLRFHRPYAVLDGPGVWIPVWEDEAGLWVAGDGGEVYRTSDALTTMRKHLAAKAVVSGRLQAASQLVIGDLPETRRARLMGSAQPTGKAVSIPDGGGKARRLFPIVTLGEEMSCTVDSRMVLAADLWELVDAVGSDLERRGAGRRHEVRVHHEIPEQMRVALLGVTQGG